MGSLRAGLPYSWVPWTNHPLAPGLRGPTKKCTHGGHPLESPLVIKLPHVMSLHQSAPLIKSLNPVARSVWAHSSLISVAVQDGELTPVDCLVHSAYCDPDWDAQDLAPPTDGPWVFPRPVPKMYSWGITRMGQNVPVGPPDRPETGSWSPSTPHGWWVSWLFIFSGVGPFSLYLFFFFDFYRGIQGVRFSTNSAVACPPMSLPSTRQTQLGRAVLGSNLFVLIFVC